jgi:hypothetical protein
MNLKRVSLFLLLFLVMAFGTLYAQTITRHRCSGLYFNNRGNMHDQIPNGNVAHHIRYIELTTRPFVSMVVTIYFNNGETDSYTLANPMASQNGSTHYDVAWINNQLSLGIVARVIMHTDGSGNITFYPGHYAHNTHIHGIPGDAIMAIVLSGRH